MPAPEDQLFDGEIRLPPRASFVGNTTVADYLQESVTNVAITQPVPGGFEPFTVTDPNDPGFNPMPAADQTYQILPSLAAEMFGPTPYTDGSVGGLINWDMGVLVMPVAGGPGVSPIIIRVHPPVATRAVDFGAGRYGAQPGLPASNTGNPNDVVIGKSINTISPGITNQGIHTYRTEGRYEYVFLKPPTQFDNLPVGIPSWEGVLPTDVAIQPQVFLTRFLDNSQITVTDITQYPYTNGVNDPSQYIGP